MNKNIYSQDKRKYLSKEMEYNINISLQSKGDPINEEPIEELQQNLNLKSMNYGCQQSTYTLPYQFS